MLRDIVKHIGDCSSWRHGVHSNLLVTAILGQNAHERVNGTFGARVQRVFWYAEVLGCVR